MFWDRFPSMKVHRLIVWARRCYVCFYKGDFRKLYGHENDRSGGKSDGSLRVDVLKVQSRIKSSWRRRSWELKLISGFCTTRK